MAAISNAAIDESQAEPAKSKHQQFPREARLLDGASYGVVFKRNIRLSNRYWTVLAHKHSNQIGRLGLAIAKKRAKRAVDRNKIKRIARESFRHKQGQLCRFDTVVMNKDAAAKASTAELRASLDALWTELGNKLHNTK